MRPAFLICPANGYVRDEGQSGPKMLALRLYHFTLKAAWRDCKVQITSFSAFARDTIRALTVGHTRATRMLLIGHLHFGGSRCRQRVRLATRKPTLAPITRFVATGQFKTCTDARATPMKPW